MLPEAAGAAEGAASRRFSSRAAGAGQRVVSGTGRQARAVAAQGKLTPQGYQGVILAEFLAAVTIIAVLPVVSGGSPAAQAKGSMSPYDTGDLKQIVAAGAVYFVLALLAAGNRGRLSAWFGGLVLLGIGLSKVSHGQIAAAAKNLAGGNRDGGTQTV